MTVYILTTNEGTHYLRTTPEALRAAMSLYIRRKRAEGLSLAEVMYTWTSAPLRTKPPT